MFKKRFAGFTLIYCLFLAVLLCNFTALPAGAETLEDAANSLINYYKTNKAQPDNWEELVGLEQAGVIDEFDLSKWSVEINDNSQAVDYASAILGLISAGKDPQSYTDPEGRQINLVQRLVEMQRDDGGFGGYINNVIYSILALDKAGADYRAEDAVRYLINQQRDDGGFSLSGATGDPDVTGMALMALANHTGLDGVNDAVDKALNFLHAVQLETGGFASYGNENAESTAKVIQGLVACGEDVRQWNKNDHNIIQALFNFRLADGSFSHLVGGASSEMATRQVLMAVADLINSGYSDFQLEAEEKQSDDAENSNPEVSIRVEGADSTLKKGTVTVDGTALDALKELVGEDNIGYNQWGMVDSILGESGQANVVEGINTYWKYYVIRDGEIDTGAFSSGPGSYSIQDGDEVVFYIGACDAVTWADKTYIPVINISPSEPEVGQTVTMSVYGEYYDWSKNDFSIIPVDPVTVDFNGKVYTTSDSRVQIPLETAGTVTYRVYKQHAGGYPELIRSAGQLTVKPRQSDGGVIEHGILVSVKVVDNHKNLLFDGRVELSKDKADVFHALVETGLSYRTKWGNKYVSEIAGLAEDLSGTAGWKYKINGSIPSVPAIDCPVREGDDIIWFWAVNAEDTGSGELPPAVEEPEVPEIPEVPAERLKAVERSKEKVSEELKNIAREMTALAPAEQELYNIVELYDGEAVVVGAETPLTEKERKQWAEILKNNQVDVEKELKAGHKDEVSDAVGEVSLYIEKGALKEDTIIKVKKEDGAGVIVPDAHRMISPVYNFGPDGTSFAEPVTLKIKLVLPEDVTPGNLVLAWYDSRNKSWVPVPTVVNMAAGEISGLITRFTKFAVLERKERAASFADVDPKVYPWAEKAINYLAVKGIVSGTGEGNFSPERQVTRAEFVAMLVTALELEDDPDYNVNFSDISEDSWYAASVKAAVKAGLIKGYNDGTFRPHDTVTREQAAAILCRVLKLKPAEEGQRFKDAGEISPWARESVQAAADNQVVKGFADGTFRPKHSVSRAQCAVFIYRLLKLV
ncbi:hypothetical protein JOC37_000284 [Desulfohalotomaculum tongense]|uniref:S-layer homology domain-containing protein n=1 Tax=Desulforadius tongensis TaxID=1216062 RepID=UPI00195A505A|nr:S-layer homology domain-containing protein [Desulforadius tongensis]MBM7853919.1 hypothetical protein [Desulforadius tongensis]